MKREEKNQLTRNKIIHGALVEFSSQGYKAGSLNNICTNEAVSKGIIYHYFDSKDELYLEVVKNCFSLLTEYLKTSDLSNEKPENELRNYFETRMDFFNEYPLYQGIFSETVISPVEHLEEKISLITRDFDELNESILRRTLYRFKLRNNVSEEDIIKTFREFQNFINAHYKYSPISEDAFEQREKDIERVLNIMLYGIVERS